MFGIAYKENPAWPATLGGRTIGRSETFDTREEGEKFLEAKKEDWFQVVPLS